jgi:RNA polymerase sigma-70 factor, ECF subfamily
MSTECWETESELTARFERDALPLLDDLYGAARRLTRDRADAEDLVLETMLKAYSIFHSLRDQPRLCAWLHSIMHNTWIDGHRKLLSRPTTEIGGDIGDWQVHLDLLESLPNRTVVEAFEALPEILRMTVYYADIRGYRYRDIAEILGIPIGTVISRLHNARRRLRALLVDVARDHGLTSAFRGQANE